MTSNAGLYIDVSSNNGNYPNVAAYAAAGHTRLSRKVTEGTGYRWYEGDAITVKAHQLHLAVEHYHWLRPDVDALAQANFFLAALGSNFHAGDDVMCDFEATYSNGGRVPDGSDAHRAHQLAVFNARLHTALGVRPRVYTGNWYLAELATASQSECRKWDVVMSDYSGTSVLPNPYGLHYVAWQYTDRASVAGWSGPVDCNRVVAAPMPTPTGPTNSTLTVPDATVTAPGVPAEAGDHMAQLVRVDPKDCKKKGVRWPGYFLTTGLLGSLEHVETVHRLHALQHAGFGIKTISVADYKALGGQ